MRPFNRRSKRFGLRVRLLEQALAPRTFCMDQEAVGEYQSDASWFRYADEERTRLLGIDAMSEAPFFYKNRRDYILHCAMLGGKQYRAFFEERKGLDSILVDEENKLHCFDFLVRMTEHGPDFSKILVEVEVGDAGFHVRDWRYWRWYR